MKKSNERYEPQVFQREAASQPGEETQCTRANQSQEATQCTEVCCSESDIHRSYASQRGLNQYRDEIHIWGVRHVLNTRNIVSEPAAI